MKKRILSMLMAVVMVTMVFTMVPANASADAGAPEGMVSYWEFEEGSGTIAGDSMSTNPGSVQGATWTTGIVGGALAFDGVDDYVSIPASASLGGMSALTLESWFYMEAYPTSWIPITPHATSSAAPFEVGYGLHYNSGNNEIPQGGFRAHVGTSSTGGSWYHLDIVYPLSTNTWYHTAQVYDGSNLIVYLNGQMVGTLPGLSGTVKQVFDVTIGRAWLNNNYGWNPPGGWRLDGMMDEVAIYSRALTLEEISQHYNNGLEGNGYNSVSQKETIDDAISALDDAKLGDNDKIDKKLDKAIKHLLKSLNIDPENPTEAWKDKVLWLDDDELDPKEGKHVIGEWAKTAKELSKLIKEDNKGKLDVPDPILELCQDTIDMLVDMAQQFATDAYSAAEAIGGDEPWENEAIGGDEPWENELEKAKKDLDKAQDDLDHLDKDGNPDPKYDKAIKHYKKAWEHAQKAMKHAA